MKTKVLNLRMEPEVHELLSSAASAFGKSLTAFITEASVMTAQKQLLDQRMIEVNAEEFAAIEEILSGDAKPSERLVDLFRDTPDWIN